MVQPMYTIDDDGNAVFPLPPAKDGMAMLDCKQLRMALDDSSVTGDILIDFSPPVVLCTSADLPKDFVLEPGHIQYLGPDDAVSHVALSQDAENGA